MLYLFKKIIVLMLLVIIVIIPFSILNKAMLKSMYNNKNFKISTDISTIIAGDSHSETSINPDILKKSINISSSGECIFFTYYKLKKIVQLNKHIKNIVLSFSYHNIAKKYQEDYLYDKVKSAFSFDNYYYFLDYNVKKELFVINNIDNNITFFLKNEFGVPLMEYKDAGKFKILLRSNIDRSDIKGYGAFSSSDKNNINYDKIKNKINLYFLDSNMSYTGSSKIIMNYTENIVKLCRDNNIKLYLYNSPLHETYINLIPTKAKYEYNTFINYILSKYNNVEFIDYTKEPLNDDFFSDGDHINIKGSKVISEKIANKIAVKVNL